jgi:DNA-binding transcriptional LysR family regulator
LSAAARIEGVTPAIIGRRLDALEARLGVQAAAAHHAQADADLRGAGFPRGLPEASSTTWPMPKRLCRWAACAPAAHLKVSAPAGFGRRHVAPLVGEFMLANPEVTVNLDLSDRLVDLLNENIDCAIRIGELTDSSLVSVRLGEMRRMVVASPAYLVAHGVPRAPADLARHNCLSLGQQRGWVFRDPAWRGRHDQGQRHFRMQRRRRAARMGAGRPRPGLALAVGGRPGL